MRKSVIIVLITICVIVIVGVVHRQVFRSDAREEEIVFRVYNVESNSTDMYIIDKNGNSIRWLGGYSGSPSWSNSGDYIAVGCKDKLCVIDVSTLPDKRNNLNNQPIAPQELFRLDIPQQCYQFENYNPRANTDGILSTSWSPDDKKIAIVCGNEQESERAVCIIPLEGKQECWGDKLSENVIDVSWSPNEEEILLVSKAEGDITSPQKIYLTDSNGVILEYLVDGFSPEWSSEGQKFVYTQKVQYSMNLAIFDLSKRQSQNLQIADKSLFTICQYRYGCRFSWSPDERYVIFSYKYAMESYENALFRIDLFSGKVIRLIDPHVFLFPAEPNWK